MEALVMAGGKGSRLGLGEKPMVCICGRPMVDYVITALEATFLRRIHIAVTGNVPKTRSWAIERGLRVLDTAGVGYVHDYIQAVRSADITGPVLIIMADLPLVSPSIIDEIVKVYEARSEPALSTHTPFQLHRNLGRRPESLFNYRGKLIVPSGVNVLDASVIDREQEDYHLVMNRLEMAINVNNPEDLSLCRRILQEGLLRRYP